MTTTEDCGGQGAWRGLRGAARPAALDIGAALGAERGAEKGATAPREAQPGHGGAKTWVPVPLSSLVPGGEQKAVESSGREGGRRRQSLAGARSAAGTASPPPSPCGKGPRAVVSVGRAQSLAALRRQVEYYFGTENLCRDVYLRGKMARAGGWVPLAAVMAFNRVRPLCPSAAFFAEALGDSALVELGGAGPGGVPTALRRRGDWAAWLLPDAAGGHAPETAGASLPDAAGAPVPDLAGGDAPAAEDVRGHVLVFVAPFRTLRRRLRGGASGFLPVECGALAARVSAEYRCGGGHDVAFVPASGDDIGRGHAFGWAFVPQDCERREAAASALLAPLRDAGLELHRYGRFHERALAERARLGPGRAHEADTLFRVWAHALCARLSVAPLDSVLFGHFRSLALEDASLGASFGLRTLFSFFADVGALASSPNANAHARDAWTRLCPDFVSLVVADVHAGHVLGLRLLARVAPALGARGLFSPAEDVAALIASLSAPEDASRPLR